MEVLYNADQIANRIRELGRELSREYHGSQLVVVGILKGGFMFLSDLVRRIEIPVMIDFARLSSYGNADSPQGEVKIVHDIQTDIRGKDVLIVDDILDTGQSLSIYRQTLQERGAASVRICTLIDKTCRRTLDIQPDYYGFRISDGFIVGYGLDFAEKYRGLPEVYLMDSDNGGNDP